MCAAGSSAAVEAVMPSCSTSIQEQNVESDGDLRRCRFDGKLLEAGTSLCKGGSKFECQHCDKSFQYKSKLDRHTLTHFNVRNYECQECRKRFFDKSSLTKHTLTHSGDKNHECLECGKRFTQKFSLTQHILTHSGDKNYECEECGKQFTKKSTLTQHTLTHLNVKKYMCYICGKRFTQKSTHTQHIQAHSGAKDYECVQCGRRFAKKFNLNQHIMTHTGVKNYECEECGKKFLSSTYFNEHILRHTGFREFKCDICEKCFKTKSDIRVHMRTHFWLRWRIIWINLIIHMILMKSISGGVRVPSDGTKVTFWYFLPLLIRFYDTRLKLYEIDIIVSSTLNQLGESMSQYYGHIIICIHGTKSQNRTQNMTTNGPHNELGDIFGQQSMSVRSDFGHTELSLIRS